MFFERHGLSDGDGFFTEGAHVEGEFARALHFDHAVVENSESHHVFKTLNESFSVELRVPFAACLAVIVQNSNQTAGVVNRVVGGAGGRVRAVEVSGLFGEFPTKRGLITGAERSDTDGVRRGRNRASLRH